jgi:hypothetical protein
MLIGSKKKRSGKSDMIKLKKSYRIAATSVVLVTLATQAVSENGQNLREAVGVLGSSDPEIAALGFITNSTLSSMNEAANNFTYGLLGERLKYLELSLGVDEGKPLIEGMAVYGLYEKKNWFVFNQTSLVEYDSRETLNFGLGVRHINDDDTVIVGANVFHDYEFGTEHRRVGVGAEVLTSIVQLRANYYKAVTGEISNGGDQEVALDGHDIKFSYELPFFYSSNVFLSEAQWYDDTGYRTSSTKFGASAELAPNFLLEVSGERDDANEADIIASVSYHLNFGEKRPNRTPRDGVFRFKLDPVRHMLYQPVQRENRIMKKIAKIGVTVSGY